MNDFLVLVDNCDNEIGLQEKISVHQQGLLHRAFSVFIFNTKGELLLQQRAPGKYHSAGLWSNTCCSHPKFNEEITDAIKRRLYEEMGIKCKTNFAFNFIYKAEFDNGLIEHEFDHVYFGVSDDLPIPERSEVKDWKYIDLNALQQHIINEPGLYSEWLKISMQRVINHFNKFETNAAKTYKHA